MRCVLASMLVLSLASAALAQARGQVESIGFGGEFRPGCWTPMVVYLVPTTGSNFSGRIEVVQDDLDLDVVRFTRQVSLTGSPAGASPLEQRFWMYFIPQPSRGNRVLDDRRTLPELTDIIRVQLTSDSGKELVRLPITQLFKPIESPTARDTRGQKLVLCVHKDHLPNLREYQGLLGVTEEVRAVSVRDVAFGLPDDVIGYDAVDAIIWSDGDPAKLSDQQLRAIEQFVRAGKRLVFAQDTAPNQWQRNNQRFAPLMPVTVQGVHEISRLESLRQLAHADPRRPDWNELRGPFRQAKAQPLAGANVLLRGPEGSPYLVRRPLGAGSVTWCAQDLGDPALLGARQPTRGWANVWDTILDWKNDPLDPQRVPPPQRQLYAANVTAELGRSLLKYLDIPSTSAALIGVAVLFLVLYWVAAGPGSFLVLARRARPHLNWLAFAAIAIAATGLTVAIVKLMLRGRPQLQHVSYVRVVRGEPTSVVSGLGLYIPRDGLQKIELKDAAAGHSSDLSAFALHPAFNESETEFPAKQQYRVFVREVLGGGESGDPTALRIPYRSTMKKLSAHWEGALPGGIEGTPKLFGEVPLARGALRNNCGQNLRMVCLAFHHPNPEGLEPRDYVLFVSHWKAGEDLDLAAALATIRNGGAPSVMPDSVLLDPADPAKLIRYLGRILPDRQDATGAGNWTQKWYAPLRGESGLDKEWTESDPLTPAMFPVLSLFDRIYPSRNDLRKLRGDRVDVLRRGARRLDLSAAISAGQMVILAVAENADQPLPFPLDVEGQRIKGKGVVYYQFVIPVDGSGLSARSATQASGNPPG